MEGGRRSQALLIALVAGGIGWWMGNASSDSADLGDRTAATRPVPVAARPLPRVFEVPQPQIVVARDGSVTLHVDQQPLTWVIEQIEAQAGPVGEGACRSTPPAATQARVPRTAARLQPTEPSTSPQHAARLSASTNPGGEHAIDTLIDTLQYGAEPERYRALRQAVESGVKLPDDLLRDIYEAEGSERLSQLAFEAYLEPLQDSPEGLRGALQDAQLASNRVVREDASRRLHDLEP